ncbi:alpha-amylase [Streptomyces durbertensis]|uniref:Alpha-amylase inhibitor n=1 Tax=Streptomyces durbertensis TaxID=2448886 RepID=A0ABR6EKG1_9ACTN|nr:alpha-amylase [Streptomyces durbertensis]MBB1245597.1 alpha-amylase [Streptomyces durbertensis]
MSNLMSRISRPVALTATTAAGLLMALTATPSAAAATTEPAPPECVQYHSSWRYTHVSNSCDATVAVTVEYTNGQDAPCRVIQPGEWATFSGYGTQSNYVTALRSCDPTPAAGV